MNTFYQQLLNFRNFVLDSIENNIVALSPLEKMDLLVKIEDLLQLCSDNNLQALDKLDLLVEIDEICQKLGLDTENLETNLVENNTDYASLYNPNSPKIIVRNLSKNKAEEITQGLRNYWGLEEDLTKIRNKKNTDPDTAIKEFEDYVKNFYDFVNKYDFTGHIVSNFFTKDYGEEKENILKNAEKLFAMNEKFIYSKNTNSILFDLYPDVVKLFDDIHNNKDKIISTSHIIGDLIDDKVLAYEQSFRYNSNDFPDSVYEEFEKADNKIIELHRNKKVSKRKISETYKKHLEKINENLKDNKFLQKLAKIQSSANVLTNYSLYADDALNAEGSVFDLSEQQQLELIVLTLPEIPITGMESRRSNLLKNDPISSIYLEKNNIQMSKAEKAVLNAYFGVWNPALNVLNNAKIENPAWEKFNELMSSALKKLPNYQGQVMRGEAFENSLNDIKGDGYARWKDLDVDTYIVNTFLSTTVDESVKKVYSSESENAHADNNITIYIETKKGKYVDPFNGFPCGQIVIPKGTKLQKIKSNFETREIWFKEI